MSRLRYLLSNRQKKELDRGMTISIVLPLPHDFPSGRDPLAYARQVLDPRVRQAEIFEVPIVAPLVHSGDGLVNTFGAILQSSDARDHRLVYRMICVVCGFLRKCHGRTIPPAAGHKTSRRVRRAIRRAKAGSLST